MRLNAYIALSTGLSRRAADRLISNASVEVNGQTAEIGQQVKAGDKISINSPSLSIDTIISSKRDFITVALNKPVGYVCSRQGQGSKTIYDLLPESLHYLKPIGRLDKESSGLILLTNDGRLAQRLLHPRHQKEKVYEVTIDAPLSKEEISKLKTGMELDDGPSKFKDIRRVNPTTYEVALTEGRNRQIRRTFDALGYKVAELHRVQFGPYKLKNLKLKSGELKELPNTSV